MIDAIDVNPLIFRYLLLSLAAINIIVAFVYSIDKLLAILGWLRISERMLLTLTVLGGGAGAMLAMIVCRHKIRKPKFWIFSTISTLLDLLLLYYLCRGAELYPLLLECYDRLLE